jgi:hypothetical protein
MNSQIEGKEGGREGGKEENQHVEGMSVYLYICTTMFTEALFTITNIWTQP